MNKGKWRDMQKSRIVTHTIWSNVKFPDNQWEKYFTKNYGMICIMYSTFIHI